MNLNLQSLHRNGGKIIAMKLVFYLLFTLLSIISLLSCGELFENGEIPKKESGKLHYFQFDNRLGTNKDDFGNTFEFQIHLYHLNLDTLSNFDTLKAFCKYFCCEKTRGILNDKESVVFYFLAANKYTDNQMYYTDDLDYTIIQKSFRYKLKFEYDIKKKVFKNKKIIATKYKAANENLNTLGVFKCNNKDDSTSQMIEFIEIK